MKLTKSKLKQIIKEELGKTLNETSQEIEGVPESAIKEFLLKGGFYGVPEDPDLDELEQEWGYIRGYLREAIKMIWEAKKNAYYDYQETVEHDEYQDEYGRD